MDRVLVLEDHGTFRGRPLLRLGRGASSGFPGGGKDTGESDKGGGGSPPALAWGTATPPPPSGIGQKGTVLERQVMVLVFGEV